MLTTVNFCQHTDWQKVSLHAWPKYCFPECVKGWRAVAWIRERSSGQQGFMRFPVSSAELSAKRLAHAIRSHWHIKNKLHWKLDVPMKEDDCRIRRGDGAEILAGFRHIAINLLNNQKSFSGRLERKQMKAQRSTSYLAPVLAGQGCS